MDDALMTGGAVLTRADALIDLRRYREALTLLHASDGAQADTPFFWELVSRAHFGLHEYQVGLSAAHKHVQAAPGSAWGPYAIAVAQHGLKNYKQAMTAAERAIALDPQFAWGHAQYALSAAHCGRRHARRAAEAADRAISLRPTDPDLRNNAGLVHLERDRRRARSYFEDALQLQPDHTAALHNLGVCDIRIVRFGSGLRQVLRAATLDPTASEAARAVELVVHRWFWLAHLVLFAATPLALVTLVLDSPVVTAAAAAGLAALLGWGLVVFHRVGWRRVRRTFRVGSGLLVWAPALLVAYLALVGVVLLPGEWGLPLMSVPLPALVVGAIASRIDD